MGKQREMAKTPSVLAQVVALERMDLEELSAQYRTYFAKEPPSKTRKQLVARLAYRIQEIVHGGLSQEARSRLEEIHEVCGLPGRLPEKKERKNAPAPGTKLIREYLGVVHEVIVRDKGFEYRGGMYRSLSAIATAISGSHVSGPVFFGIKKKGGGA